MYPNLDFITSTQPYQGPFIATFRCSAWLGALRLARLFETTRRPRRIAHILILYARKAVGRVFPANEY